MSYIKNNNLLFSNKFSLGKSLYYILEKYAFFDYKNYGIDVEGPQFYYNLKKIKNEELKYDNIEVVEEINILDPFTKLNVAKSSFQIIEIRNTFNKGLNLLKFEAWKYDSNPNNNIFGNSSDFILIKKLFLNQ